MDRIPLTREGAERLRQELHHLKSVERPKVIQAITEARAHGDLRENAEYQAAREKQSFIEGRIREIEAILSQAEIIDVSQLSGDRVVFGATVELEDLETGEEVTYQIVGDVEANIEEGRIAISAPIARALIGKEVGDIVEVKTPRGVREYEILAVRFGS